VRANDSNTSTGKWLNWPMDDAIEPERWRKRIGAC
jgi:hypothetical protein